MTRGRRCAHANGPGRSFVRGHEGFVCSKQRADVFSARSYPHGLFSGLADPVLNVDWFDMSGPTFPPHPHAGFSAVTWLFSDSHNGFVNRDSLGNVLQIAPGALHWSRASAGLVHEETPMAGKGTVSGLQIFLNLPEARQLDKPAAFHVDAGQATVQTLPGAVVSTPVDGLGVGDDAHALPSAIRLSQVQLDADASFDMALPAQFGGLVIVLHGRVRVADQPVLDAPQAIAFATDEKPDALRFIAQDEPVKMAVIAGTRLYQPVVEQGPFKLASQQALQARIAAFQRGEFGEIAAES